MSIISGKCKRITWKLAWSIFLSEFLASIFIGLQLIWLWSKLFEKKHMFSSLLMCLHLIESAVTREIRSWVVGMWGSLYSSLLIAWFKLCNKKYIKPLYIEPSLPFVFQLNFLLEQQYHILYSLCTYLEPVFNLLQSFETAKWQQINSLFFYIEV